MTVLLTPANRKSAVFSEALKPLKELEAEAIEAKRPEVARLKSERRQAKERLRNLERKAASGDEQSALEAAELAARLEVQPEPAEPRYIIDDATEEKIAIVLSEQSGRIASMAPEGGVYDNMAGKYSRTGTPQFNVYLSAHNGDDIIVDRVGRTSLRIERPALTCAYTVQPAVIDGLARFPAFRGRGLLARFLYAAPTSWVGNRDIAPDPVSDAILEAYRQLVRRLSDVQGEHVVRFSTEADLVLREFEGEVERMLKDGGQLEPIRDWGGKLVGATVRIATILHCAEHGPVGSVGPASVASAIKIGRYLVPHAENVLSLMQAKDRSDSDDALYFLRWINDKALNEFTRRDAHQHGKYRFAKARDIDPELTELARRGYISLKVIPTAGPGRPASPVFEVNPLIVSQFNMRDPSLNSHNSERTTKE